MCVREHVSDVTPPPQAVPSTCRVLQRYIDTYVPYHKQRQFRDKTWFTEIDKRGRESWNMRGFSCVDNGLKFFFFLMSFNRKTCSISKLLYELELAT